ncbi:hypothetical protein ACTPEM_25810, partial [Clostridioides difficile]
EKFEEFKGEIPSRGNGVLIAQGPGVTMGYSLNALSDRAVMFVFIDNTFTPFLYLLNSAVIILLPSLELSINISTKTINRAKIIA